MKWGFFTLGRACLLIKEQTKESWKEEATVCLQMHSECQLEYSHLGFCKNNKEKKDITALIDTWASAIDAPRIWRIRLLSDFLKEDDTKPCIVRKSTKCMVKEIAKRHRLSSLRTSTSKSGTDQ